MPETKIKKPPISVVLPAFNEADGIAGVLAELHRVLQEEGRKSEQDYEIIVVDDGSEDETASLAEQGKARVISHPVNVGYGKSLLTGFSAARFDWILMLDADGSYPPEEVRKLLAYAPDCDMVVGVRQGALFWGNYFKAFLRWVYLRLASFVAGVRIPDANSGLRLIRKRAVTRDLPILCYGYSLSTTMTLSFIQGGLFVRFVPVTYAARKGSSKVRPLRDILRTLQIMVQVILYYNPLKFSVFLALIPGAFAALFAARFACRRAPLDLALLCVCALAILFVFLAGCVLDAMRLHREPSPRDGV